jgi:hypothetical protein
MQSMSLTQLSAILAVTTRLFLADFAGARTIQLYLYAHCVDGLLPSWSRSRVATSASRLQP